ncbi:MAG: MFS transporter [Clostridia bacterium]|nr:MFS transporter [Clostridia bacterium]
MKNSDTRNRYCWGLGTVGRDMFYAFEANTILYFLTSVLSLPMWVFAVTSTLLSVLRIVDAINDPITGFFIDNIRSPWGKYKPAIVLGGVVSAASFVMLFANISSGWGFILLFALAYIIWDISYGVNDIAYWTLLPALTQDQKQREKFGAFARICANIGMYIVMVGWEPVTASAGNTPSAWLAIAIALACIYLLFLLFPLLGVKENHQHAANEEKTTLKQMVRALIKNDQLMWTTLSMGLFMVGYCTTTGFAVYYMEYIFGNKGMYAVLAAVCGVSQLAALAVFPAFSKRFNRKQLYTGSTLLILIGYAVFFFAEASIVLIALCAVLLFVGQAFIQLLMLMFLADTIEYGQWKLGKRSESITFSLQPLINKIGGALSTALISVSIVLSGIKTGDTAAVAIDQAGKNIVKLSMFLLPLICIVLGYIIYLKKYKISEEYYKKITDELKMRGELSE